MYCVPGVNGGVAFGSKPKSDRCVGVRGISVSSSVFFMRGNRAIAMLKRPSRHVRKKRGVVRGRKVCETSGIHELFSPINSDLSFR